MTMPTESKWSSARNLLCVRLDALDDVLMTSAAMYALKKAVSGRRITLLTSRSGAAAASLMPFIDNVIVYDPPWMKSTGEKSDGRQDREFIESLREGEFDGAVIFTVYSQNPLPAALTLYLADIPLRAAYCRENPYHLLTDWVQEREPQEMIRHEVQRQLDLVRALGVEVRDQRMKATGFENALPRVEEMLEGAFRDARRDDAPLIVLHPGSTAPSRRYDPKKFSDVARELHHTGAQIVLTGSADEESVINQIIGESGVPLISLAGALELKELAALLSMADLLIANNTGPVHLAAAVGTPIVDLYALTNPQHTPWGVPCAVLYHPTDCGFCYKSVCREGHHDCLEKVTPTQVISASLALLKSGKSSEFIPGEVVHLPLAGRTN